MKRHSREYESADRRARIEIIRCFRDNMIIPSVKGSSRVLTEISKPGLAIKDFPTSFCSRFTFAFTFLRRALVVVLSSSCIVSFPWFLSRVKSVHFSQGVSAVYLSASQSRDGDKFD